MVDKGREVLKKQDIVFTQSDDILDAYVSPPVKEAHSAARYSYSPKKFVKIIGSRPILAESGEGKQPLAKCRSAEQQNKGNCTRRYVQLQSISDHVQTP
jgi:hypothetical protein